MSFENWFQERFIVTNPGRASYDRGILETNCPFCKDNEHKFWFSLQSMRGGCLHKSRCSWRGDSIKFIMAVEGCSVREALAVVRDSGGLLTVSRRMEKADDPGACRLPMEFWGLTGRPVDGLARQCAMTAALAHLHSRGVLDEQIDRHGVGYCIGGRYNDRVVVPVVERGAVVFFVARLFRGRGLKYRYPTMAEAGGRGPSDVLFNLDGVAGRPRVRVVEGVFDALAEERRGQASVAMLGLGISEIQAAKLALAGCQEAIVECDADAPLRAIEQVARRLEGVMRVRVARPERDPDQQVTAPTAGRWGIAERVRARLASHGGTA